MITLSEAISKMGTAWLFNNVTNDIAPEVRANLVDWFEYRYLCCEDANRFQHYFRRELNLSAKRFNRLYEAQLMEIDPLLTRKLKEQITANSNVTTAETSDSNDTYGGTVTDSGNVRATNSNNSQNKTSGGDKTTTTSDTTTSNEGSSTTTATESSDTNGATRSDNTSRNEAHAYDRQLFSDTPQSNVSASTSGDPGDIRWTYATNLTDNISKSTNTDTTNTTGENSSHTAGNSTTEQTNTDTTDTNATSTTRTELGAVSTATGSSTTETTTGNTTTDNRTKDTTAERNRNETGSNTTERTASEQTEAAQDLLRRYYSYVLDTNAFEWLLSQLETCFLSLYEV